MGSKMPHRAKEREAKHVNFLVASFSHFNSATVRPQAPHWFSEVFSDPGLSTTCGSTCQVFLTLLQSLAEAVGTEKPWFRARPGKVLPVPAHLCTQCPFSSCVNEMLNWQVYWKDLN